MMRRNPRRERLMRTCKQRLTESSRCSMPAVLMTSLKSLPSSRFKKLIQKTCQCKKFTSQTTEVAHFVTFFLYHWQHFSGYAPAESEDDNSEGIDDVKSLESQPGQHHEKPAGMGLLLAKEHSVIKHLDDKLNSEVDIITVIYSSSS